MTTATNTYPKKAMDVLPLQIIVSASGNHLRVIGSRRVRKGWWELTLMDTHTGVQRTAEYPGAADVQVLLIGRKVTA